VIDTFAEASIYGFNFVKNLPKKAVPEVNENNENVSEIEERDQVADLET